MAATLTNVQDAIREYVVKKQAEILWGGDNLDGLTPFFGILSKKAGNYDHFGRKFVQPITINEGQAVSADWLTAQQLADGTLASTTGASGNVEYRRWEIPETRIYGFADIELGVFDEKNSESTRFDLVKNEIDKRMFGIRLDMCRSAFNNASGSLCQISARTATTITVPKWALPKFRRGMRIVAALADTSGNLRSATSLEVTQINLVTGVVTVAGGDPTALGWTANDYVFRVGDRANGVTAAKMYGLDAWIKKTDPADTFAGVVRTGAWELYGLQYDATGKSVKDALLGMSSMLYQFGSNDENIFFLSVKDYTTLEGAVDTAVKQDKVTSKQYDIGFEGLTVTGAGGKAIKVLCDPMVPDNEVFGGPFRNEDYVYLVHSGDGLINIDDHDGNMFKTKTNGPGYQVRLYSRSNLVVAAPGKFIRAVSANF